MLLANVALLGIAETVQAADSGLMSQWDFSVTSQLQLRRTAGDAVCGSCLDDEGARWPPSACVCNPVFLYISPEAAPEAAFRRAVLSRVGFPLRWNL